MKKILILTLFSLSLSPVFAQGNYSNTAIQTYNAGVAFHKQHNLDAAEQKYRQTLKIQPDFAEAKQNLSAVYHTKALDYLKTNQNEKAQKLYYEILLITPKDNVAQQNLKYISQVQNEQFLNNSVNNMPVVPHAPQALYKLIKPSAGITKNTVERMKYILDLVWSEPNGQLLLQGILNHKIRINITQGVVTANAMHQKRTNTILLYGFIPIFSYDTSSNAVNIAFNYISDFYNPKIDAHHRIYDLQVFVHEFGHAFMFSKNSGHKDSIEEELGVSMLGYNSAYKILTGQYLTKEQTIEYSMSVLQSLLSDSHRDLPVHNGFNNEIQYYGIRLPYPETYSNLPAMYKKLLYEGKISPVPNFYMYGR